MRRVVSPLLGAITGCALLSSTALAQTSQYSTITENCTLYQMRDEPVWESGCAGLADWSVFFISSEHGSSTAYSWRDSIRSDYMTPPTRGMFGNYGSTIEWRFAGETPVATIHRYINYVPRMDGEGPSREFHNLQVTALKPHSEQIACTIGTVDASHWSNANALAQEMADRFAPDWDCATDHPINYDANQTLDLVTLQAQRRPGH